MASKRKRVVKYRKPLNINIGSIIFALVFVYVIVSSFIYFTRDKISIYEVVKGENEEIPSLRSDGVALRNEVVSYADNSGNINYYVKEGTRVSVSQTLYSIDESGSLTKLLEEAAQEGNVLSNENLSSIKYDIKQFIKSYTNNNFSDAYNFKYDLNTSLIEFVNLNTLSEINESLSQLGTGVITVNQSQTAGIVEFYLDGYEGLTPDKLTGDLFKKNNYNKKSLVTGEAVEKGAGIYKTINSENWQVVVKLNEKQFDAYQNIDAVDVFFPSKNLSTVATMELMDIDGEHCAVLSLKRFMMQFAEQRFVDIIIKGDTSTGLKVPKSSVIQKEYYVIPEEFLMQGPNGNEEFFYKIVLGEDGQSKAVEVEADYITKKDGFCYVEKTSFQPNDILVKSDSTSQYIISQIGTLNGVYNVNTGYTQFKYIEILSEKNGYYIVKSGSKYGVQIFDKIVLDAKKVKENSVIYADL